MSPSPARIRAPAAFAAAALLLSCGGSGSSIHLRYGQGAGFSPTQRQLLEAARTRLSGILTGGLISAQVNGLSCGEGAGAVTIDETVNGLLVLVSVQDLQSPGTLAESGPCIVGSQSRRPVVAVLRFNSQNIDTLSQVEFQNVALHELLHTVGFGTIWAELTPPLLAGHGSSDPTFTGPQALAAAKGSNSAPSAWTSIPVEDTGMAGTLESHWRKSVFGTELMTGWIATGAQPLSATTIASLADLGYTVDLGKADPYTIPSAGLQAFPEGAAPRALGDDVLHLAPAVVDEAPAAP